MDSTFFLCGGEARFYLCGYMDFRVIGFGLQKIPYPKLLYYAVMVDL
jgi:hypothetical protein